MTTEDLKPENVGRNVLIDAYSHAWREAKTVTVTIEREGGKRRGS